MAKGRKRHAKKSFTSKLKRKRPIFSRDKDGEARIDCPFCAKPHPLSGEAAHCGAYLEIMAIQPSLRGKAMTCIRCGKSTGTFIKAGDGQYMHDHDCQPGTSIHFTPPKMSKLAGLAWKLPDSAQVFMAKRFKVAPEQLYALDEEGKMTDEIVGHRWRKYDGTQGAR